MWCEIFHNDIADKDCEAQYAQDKDEKIPWSCVQRHTERQCTVRHAYIQSESWVHIQHYRQQKPSQKDSRRKRMNHRIG